MTNKIPTTIALLLLLISTIWGRTAEHILYFPHFGNGDGTKSEIVIVNPGESEVNAEIRVYRDDGEMLDAAQLMLSTDDFRPDIETFDAGIALTRPILPLEARTIATSGEGELVKGWVSITSESPLSGFLRYRMGDSVAVVQASTPTFEIIVPYQVKMYAVPQNKVNTALALHNPGWL